jgi:hypothetical protein
VLIGHRPGAAAFRTRSKPASSTASKAIRAARPPRRGARTLHRALLRRAAWRTREPRVRTGAAPRSPAGFRPRGSPPSRSRLSDGRPSPVDATCRVRTRGRETRHALVALPDEAATVDLGRMIAADSSGVMS